MPLKIPGFGAEPHSMLFNVLRRSLIILVYESVGLYPQILRKSHNYFIQQTGQDKQDIRNAARAIIEGREESLSSLDDLRAACIRLAREYKAYCYAVEFQEREIRSRRMEASQEMHPLIRTRYEGLIRKVIFTYAEFQKASLAEDDFREMLILKDVAFLGAIHLMGIDLPGHFRNSTDWENYVAEAVESGYLSQSEAKQLTAKGKAA